MLDVLFILAPIAAVNLAGAASPGPAFLAITRIAASTGRGAGLRCAAGLALGSAFWATAALFGLAAVFAAAPWLAGALKLVGAGYLLWLAFSLWRRASEPADEAPAAPRPFRSALLLQLSNPKTAVFFGSIFVTVAPVDASAALSAAIVATVAAVDLAWFCTLALAFGSAPVQRRYANARGIIDRVCGAAMTALAMKLASS